MKNKTIKNLVLENLYILIPFILYGIYKNGYLIYQRKLINIFMILKPLYLVLIGLAIKIIIDLVKNKKIIIDYNLLYVVLIAMIMPYNINLIIYTITFLLSYILLLFLDKYFKLNKVCLIYLIIVLVNTIFNNFTYLNPLEEKYNFSFSFLDLLIGRNVGGISATSILFDLIAFYFLTFNFYYKKDIPLIINITYLCLAFIYFFITNNSNYLLNSELIFASIFISTLPMYSPYKVTNQIIYSIFIGLITFIISITFNSVISIYIATLLTSLLSNIKIKKKKK